MIEKHQDLIILLIGVVILIYFLGPTIQKLIDYFAQKPRKKKIETVDILGEVKQSRLKVAKSQKPRDMKRLIFLGDEDAASIIFPRIKGVIPDSRCYEFFIRFRWYKRISWVFIPTKHLNNTVGGDIYVDARGLRSLSVYFIPVLSARHTHEQHRMVRMVLDYVENILHYEGVAQLDADRINSRIAASSPSIVREEWVPGYGMALDEIDEEDDDE